MAGQASYLTALEARLVVARIHLHAGLTLAAETAIAEARAIVELMREDQQRGGTEATR